MKEGTHTAQGQEALRQDTLTSETVSSQKVRPEAASVSLPAFSGVGQGEREQGENQRKVTYLHPTTQIRSPLNQKRSKYYLHFGY